MNEELLRNLPEDYAALADRRRVMHEVADELGDLHTAVNTLGDALEAAGLPGRMWRAQDASLRLIARGLPGITVDRFMTRLAEFAAGNGPTWLHGGSDDLAQFHREVRAIARVVDHLSDSVQHGLGARPSSRPPQAIELAFGNSKVSAVLEQVAEILTDLRALEPFMAPLRRDEWQPRAKPVESLAPAGGDAQAHGDTLPLSADASHAKLRDYARATLKPRLHDNGTAGDRLNALLDRLNALLARAKLLLAELFGRKRLVALAAALLVVTAFAVLLLHHQSSIGSSLTRGPSNDGLSATQASGTQVSATHAAVKASPTATRPPTTKTPVPAPQLALTCKIDPSQTNATLTITNTGRVTVSWQATASHWLSVTPAKGQVSVGQVATAQVTPTSKRGWVTNTVSVSASNGAKSTSFSATCK